MGGTKGGPSSRIEKKPTIYSCRRHAVCDSVLSYERNRCKFERPVRNCMGNNKQRKSKIANQMRALDVATKFENLLAKQWPAF